MELLDTRMACKKTVLAERARTEKTNRELNLSESADDDSRALRHGEEGGKLRQTGRWRKKEFTAAGWKPYK